tara:strand:- start:1324 stop:1848 length:525 start_codon:yes stop_codon:yes gene_type:complete
MKDWTETIFIQLLMIMFLFSLSKNLQAADTNIYYKDQPPASAISPSISIGGGTDVCVVVRSGAIGTGLFNASAGIHVIDKTCERIKLSRAMAQLGLRVSATAILCQDPRVWQAMWDSNSPCPIDGKIGEEAKKLYIERGMVQLDEEGNLVGTAGVMHINISKPRRLNDLGQPTE